MAIKMVRADGTVTRLDSIDLDKSGSDLIDDDFGSEARDLIARALEFNELAERAEQIGITDWANNGDEARFYSLVSDFVKDE